MSRFCGEPPAPVVGAGKASALPAAAYTRALRRSLVLESLLSRSWTKLKLRSAFVARALTYIGAPYHPKYFPDLPEDTVFLDCCGLVRRVVRDLAPNFGFKIGRWNQAYQLDSLPAALERKEMVPGDLVFWIGQYKNPRKAPQPLNCVHVEIYLGSRVECRTKLGWDLPEICVTGSDATLGSRTGSRVQVHESFKGKPSDKYDVTAVLFRSLDTWLDGTCQGHQIKWGEDDVLSGSNDAHDDMPSLRDTGSSIFSQTGRTSSTTARSTAEILGTAEKLSAGFSSVSTVDVAALPKGKSRVGTASSPKLASSRDKPATSLKPRRRSRRKAAILSSAATAA